MTNGGHFPTKSNLISKVLRQQYLSNSLENSYHFRFTVMEDKIINLIIAMNQGATVPRLEGRRLQECNRFVKMGDVPHRSLTLDVNCERL